VRSLTLDSEIRFIQRAVQVFSRRLAIHSNDLHAGRAQVEAPDNTEFINSYSERTNHYRRPQPPCRRAAGNHRADSADRPCRSGELRRRHDAAYWDFTQRSGAPVLHLLDPGQER
jgi:hypothetical protein